MAAICIQTTKTLSVSATQLIHTICHNTYPILHYINTPITAPSIDQMWWTLSYHSTIYWPNVMNTILHSINLKKHYLPLNKLCYPNPGSDIMKPKPAESTGAKMSNINKLHPQEYMSSHMSEMSSYMKRHILTIAISALWWPWNWTSNKVSMEGPLTIYVSLWHQCPLVAMN